MISRRVATSRWHWRNWPVLVKVVAAGLVPTLVALVLGVQGLVDQAGTGPGFSRISQLVGVQQKLSELLDALARERNLATAFVANGRSGDGAALELEFRTVDSRGAAVRVAAERVEDLEPTGYATVLDQLRALRPLRQNVLTGTGPAGPVIAEYGAAIDPLVSLDAALVRRLNADAVAGAGALTDAADAAHALLVVREQVGRQHAIVLAGLIADRIRAPEVSEVRTAAIRLSAAQEEFERALDPAQRAGYVARVLGDAELSRQRLLQQVLDRAPERGGLGVAPADWDGRTAAAVGDVTGVETDLRQGIVRTAQALGDDARTAVGWHAVLLFFALALGGLIAVALARSLRRPLDVLHRAALDVAERQLPAAVVGVREGEPPGHAIEPVAVGTRDEIGQVARAFDQVHRQAVRLAGEQAQLRAHVNDIFVNLARRSQGLVERQLQVIDRLEGGELDPQQLANLFQLDHLATRMRRNSDNLLVLAGADAGKSTSRPVRLVDVLRAAVSEVEQYQRLVLQQPPGVLVLGRAAGDLVHLLAELVDNATQFSPPDTPVILRAESAADGSVRIEVTDRGVGMAEPELVEANERLAGPPVVDAAASRRMGLFVVGRLAVRHGIGVRLGRGDDGIGVVACVTMPPRLVRSASELGPSLSGAPLSGITVIPREYPADLGGHLANGHLNGAPPGRISGRALGGVTGLASAQAEQAAPHDSTPIFDDVASAWFQEDRGAPVRWSATPSCAEPAPLAPVHVEVTASGLPRRTPRALLLPGAIDVAEPAEPGIGPVRSAEQIRSRLTSYQRGIREGRRTRRAPGSDPAGSVQRREAGAAEETT